jgi:hypothetical protein
MGDESNTAPTPTAQGTLEARPLSHLLVYLRTKRLTGRLMLRAVDGRGGAIAVWRGQATAARTAPPMGFFGSVAAEMGLVEPATAETTLREAAAGAPQAAGGKGAGLDVPARRAPRAR